MPKFEYKVLNYNNKFILNNISTMEDQLNQLGSQGWELISSLPLVKGSSDGDDVSVEVEDIKFIFKKEV